MKTINQYILRLAVAAITLFVLQNISAQTNTIYYMGTVPQSYYLNPATQPMCDVFIGAPIVSQTYVRANTSGISASDIFFKDPESDSVIHPFHPNANVDDFLSKFGKVESFGVEAGFNLASFGFRVKDMYFSFDATIRNSAQLTYSKDFLNFLIKGNSDGQTFDFSDGGIEILEYMEFGLNISRRFGDNLQVGIRPKLLYGLGAISTISNNTSLYTSTDEWVLDADYQARIAATGVTIPVDEDGLIDLDGDFDYDSTMFTGSGYKKIFSNNRGLGIDVGVHYKPIDNLQLSLSVLDLGYIKWQENTHVASVNGTYVFNGVDGTLPDSVDFEDALLDSIKSNLNLTGSDEAFKTNLTPKLLVGARYFLTPGFDVGLLYRTEFYRTYINSDLFVLANWHPIPMISVSGSYSILSKNHSTFGLGLGLKLGPFNFYTVLDDIPLKYDEAKMEGSSFPIPLPIAQTDYNLRFGLNLVFGCNQKKKLKQDKPLFNSSDWIL